MLGGWSISQELADYIIDNHKTVLELGSGAGSQYLTDAGNTVYSVEHNKMFMYRYDTIYIYCPLYKGWYDPDTLQKGIEYINYDCLLVDGPPGSISRIKFLNHLDLFEGYKEIIIDDCQRDPERRMAQSVATKLKMDINFFTCNDGKKYAVISNGVR